MSQERVALVVEDSEDIAFLYADAAQEAGYRAEIVRNGKLALARLDELTPHLVILDLHLPEVPGTEVLQAIRATPRLAATQVIVTTADSRLADTLHDVADIVLVKPISYPQLRDLAVRLAR
ncbi:MAG: response regulator [Anaerolineae bacterium]|nr:response regulator [Anaerolineae bacterium]